MINSKYIECTGCGKHSLICTTLGQYAKCRSGSKYLVTNLMCTSPDKYTKCKSGGNYAVMNMMCMSHGKDHKPRP